MKSSQSTFSTIPRPSFLPFFSSEFQLSKNKIQFTFFDQKHIYCRNLWKYLPLRINMRDLCCSIDVQRSENPEGNLLEGVHDVL